MKNTEIKINVEAREAGYKAAEAAAHAKFNAAQKAYDEACRRFATSTAEDRAEAEKAMNAAHDYCFGEAQAEYDAACKAAFAEFFSLNPTDEEIAAAEAEAIADDTGNDTDDTYEVSEEFAAEDFVEEYIFIDAAPVNHIVKVKCTCTIINGEKLLAQAGTPRIVRSDKYGAEIQYMNNGDIAYYTFDDKNFDRQTESDFFAIMAERGACTLDDVYKPTRPLVKTLYFDGGSWYHVKLEQEIVNREDLLFDKDELLIVESGRHAAKIMYLPNDDIAYFVRYLDERQWYGDFVRVDENEFWLAMAEREACILEPINNELISADYELTDRYNEFGEETRRFLVNGEIITFCRDRWLEIDSPKIRAKINRSIYYNKINYNLDEWSHPRYHELSQYHVTAAKFWWSMYKRGFMQRATPFKITLEHVDAPASIYEIMDLKIDCIRNGKNYDMFVNYGDYKIFLATVDNKRIFDCAESIRLAFANSAGVTIDTKGDITIIASEDIYILDTCAEINRHAPEGWTINFDTQKKFFPVKFNGKQVAKLDSLATQKFLSPEKFFGQFKPLVDKKFTPRDQFLADRYNELDMLEQMREEIADDDVAQLKTLEEMIEQVKRDIVSEEF